MIDVQTGKDSCAYELCKAKASALRAALHTSTAYAPGGLSEINHEAKHATENIKILYSQSNCKLS